MLDSTAKWLDHAKGLFSTHQYEAIIETLFATCQINTQEYGKLKSELRDIELENTRSMLEKWVELR